jgi:plasmid stabilization system protein ParE
LVKLIYKIVWDKDALNHLKEILAYIKKQSNSAPKIVKNAMLEHIDSVKTNPYVFEIDKLKEPIDKEFRAFVIFSYRVSYQIKTDAKEIRILRIRHTSREPLSH